MKIGINASFARKPGSGIGQVTINALKALDGFDFKIFDGNSKSAEYVLYLEEDSAELNLSNKFKKNIFLPFYRRDDLIRKIIWEKFLLPKKVLMDGCEEFISLYQCPTILSKKIQHTMVVHDIIPEIFPEYLNNWRKKIYWQLTKQAIKKADKIIAVSQSTKDDLIKYWQISEEKIEVHYIDVDEIYKKEISSGNSQAVLEKYNLRSGYIYTGGGLEKRKNTDALLRAYKLLLDENKNIPDLVISGKLMPDLAPLIIDVEKLVKELEIENKVKIIGFAEQKDLPAIYKNASMFIYPSLYEGFGLPVLEAMNVGTPAAVAKNSSLPEVAGESGIFFDGKNIEDIKNKIKELLGNQELREKNSQSGREQAGKFSWEKFIS